MFTVHIKRCKNRHALAASISDYNNPHAIAMYLKMTGLFDYEFTTGDSDNANF
jgi:hypothetical protein